MIAYLILAHADPDALRRLVDVLGSDSRSRIFLHLDRKAPLPDWCVAMAQAGSLVLVSRCAVNWAGYSMIRAMRSLLAHALEDRSVEQLAFLSGDSFPLRPVARINDELERRESGQFALWKVVHGNDATPTRRERQAFSKFHLMDAAALNPARGKLRRQLWKAWRTINAVLPYRRAAPGTLVKGSQWFLVTRAEAAMLFAADDALDSRLRRSFAPDEMLFQTRWYRYQRGAGRSPGFVDEESAVQALHYIPHHHPPEASAIQRWRRHFDPRRMTAADVDPALRSSALFARKCPAEIVQALLPHVAAATR